MSSSLAVPRHSPTRSAGRLDRDRQAAPQVFERLRKLITSLALPPGSPLSRTTLAEQFGVSSTPIRDALMRLEEEGLVEVFPQYATVVSRIDIRLAQQAHFLRLALELEIVKALALDHSGPLLDELNGVIAHQQKFAYAATGNQELWDLVRSRSGHIDRLRRLHLPTPGKAQDILRHHKLIVAAIGASRPDDAQRHLRKHLSGTLGYLAEIRARFPEYLSA
jgi:DNA-binding GntR family transcriptional regulator